MNGFLDIYTIVFLVLAVIVFLRLRNVLGRRTGHERPPFDPYTRTRPDSPNAETPANRGDKVVPLPQKSAPAAGEKPIRADRWKAHARAGSALARHFDSFAELDRQFDPGRFLDGAKLAYEMIVTAFAAGDRKALQPLLSPEVYDGFLEAIAERESHGQSIETTFIGIDKAEFVDAGLKGTLAQITVRFVSKLISATRDRAGKIIEGDDKAIHDVTDIWTFARDLSSADPNWKLIATEAAV